MIKIIKTVLISFVCVLFNICPTMAEGETDTLSGGFIKHGEKIFGEVITLDETIDGDKATEGIDFDDDDDLDFKLMAEKTFAKQKKIKFEQGFVNEAAGELRFRSNLGFEHSKGSNTTTFPFDINAVGETKFGSNNYRFFSEYAFTRGLDDNENKFWGKFSNLYLERKLSDKHFVRIGSARAPIGLEGSMSTFALPFARRAQIAREFADATATGIWFLGEKGAFDYNLGAYTSTRNTQGFKDGAEFIGRVGAKPFYKQEGSYFRNLKLYAGADIGHRSENYGVYSAAAMWEYKKFLMNFEYAYADGSNSDSLNPLRRQGLFATAGYNLTPKLQLLARYDQLDCDMDTNDDNKREYSLGLNYFVYKQRLKFMLNYVFSQNEKTDTNSNALYFVAQFFI